MAQRKQLSMTDIVERVKERIKCGSTDPIGRATHAPAPPATQAGIAVDEQTLGYPFPPLLKRLYVEVGNGGWGPGYGLLGLTGGARDYLGKTAIQDYLLRRGSDQEDPALQWSKGLLPICHWGCAIYSCIDCTQPGFPVIVFDPDAHEDGKDWTDAFFPECDGFDEWVQLWADGHDLWERLYAEDGVIAKFVGRRNTAPG